MNVQFKARPIIFSGPMVLALLAGRKTQTRRVLRDEVEEAPAMDAIAPHGTARHPAPYLDAYCGQPITAGNPRGMSNRWCWWTRDDRPGRTFKVPYVPSDRLYVREAWSHDGPDLETARSRYENILGGGVGYGPYYRATEVAPDTLLWRSPIHMPRWALILTLEVTEVRVERLQDISEADAVAEGVEPIHDHGVGNRHLHGIAFQQIWDRLHGPASWLANPWVAAISFRVHRANIDTLPTAPTSADPAPARDGVGR